VRACSTYHDGNYDVFENAQEETQLHKARLQEAIDKRTALMKVGRRCSCAPHHGQVIQRQGDTGSGNGGPPIEAALCEFRPSF
jgi:hypothetical protein